MIVLPKNGEQVAAESVDPKRLIIFSFPKCGKSEMCLKLPNSILIDVENSTNLYVGTKIVIDTVAKEEGKSRLATLKLVADALKKDPRDYVILDTVTELEDMCMSFAVHKYKNSLQGKNYDGTNLINDLGMNAYGFIREAFEEILGWFEGTYTKGIIYLCHIKLASITKNNVDIQVKDLQLLGKHKQLLAKDCDAIGLLLRNKEDFTENIISFKTNSNDIVSGARPLHLSNAEFVISKKNADGTLTTHWDKIFTELKKK